MDKAGRKGGRGASMRVMSAMLVTGAAASACIPRHAKGFESSEPVERIGAIGSAVRARDTAAVPELIELLDADDAAVRMFSIRALESITGRTMGYDHAGPESERRAAIDRWVRWRADGIEEAREQP